MTKTKKRIHLRYQAEILSGPVAPLIFKLGLPSMVALFVQHSFNLVDRWFVSHLGETELASVGVAFVVQSFIIALAGGVSSGLRSHTSRSAGADKKEAIEEGAHQVAYLVIILGFILFLLGPFLSGRLFLLMGVNEAFYDSALSYTSIICYGAIFHFITMCGNSLLRGIGEMKIPMKLMLMSVAINLLLDPILIFGWGPVSPMGVRGAAWATFIARAFAAFGAIIILQKEGILDLSTLFPLGIDKKVLKSLLKVGLPSTLNRSLNSLGMAVIYSLVTPFGVGATAAYSVGMTYQRLLLIPVHGFSGASVTIMGSNYGAGNIHRVKDVYKKTLLIVGLYVLLCSFIIELASVPLSALMLHQSPEGFSAGVLMLRVLALSYVFIALRVISIGGLNAMAEGTKALIVSLAQKFIFTFPVAWICSKYWGLLGLWMGLSGGYIISALVAIATMLITLKIKDDKK